MNEENSIGKINKLAFWPAVIALVVFVIAGIVNTQAVGNAMTKILSVIANYFWSVYQYFITGILNTRGSDHHWKVWGCDHWRERCQTRLQYANMVCDVNLFRNWNGIVILGDWGTDFPLYADTNSDWTGTDKNSRYFLR